MVTKKARNPKDAADATPSRAPMGSDPLRRWAPLGVVVYAGASLAVAAGVDAGVGVLLLAFGVLLGAIGAFWASVRALSDDVPLTIEDALSLASPTATEEQKRAVLQALRDLDYERSVGKVSDRDYETLLARYRAEAKRLLRNLDEDFAPQRERAEAFLAGKLGAGGRAPSAKRTKASSTRAAALRPDVRADEVCPSCSTANDPDAVFCKKCGKKLSAVAIVAMLLAHLLASPSAYAADDGARARPVPAIAADTGLPPGHPPIDIGAAPDDGDTEDEPQKLPPGHPPTGGMHAPGTPRAPAEDTADVDPALPAGTIAVEVRDAKDRPVPDAKVSVGMMSQTIAKSDTHRRFSGVADASGVARFDRLPTGAATSYRVSVTLAAPDGTAGTFGAPPFRLELGRGERVRLHVYPIETRIDAVLVGMQAAAYFEIRDDTIEITEYYEIYNIGESAWIPKGVAISLPRGTKAFQSDGGMSDVGLDVDGSTARMRGTIGPGQHQLQFRFQVPYEGAERVETSLDLLPHVARMRVIAEATRDMKLVVSGFSPAQTERNPRGQRVLVSDRQQKAGERPLTRAEVSLQNLPSTGTGRYWAVGLAALIVALGLYQALAAAQQAGDLVDREREAAEARARLVAELDALAAAQQAGDLGPKAYARARQELIDALARLLPA